MGQMKAKIYDAAPTASVVDLFADLPVHNPRAAAYLLAAYADEFSPGDIFICVVDPGVGGDRPGIIVEADGRWFVGPGNGVFEIVMRRCSGECRIWEIDWRPEKLSASFHGRDIFAPIGAKLFCGEEPPGVAKPIDWMRHQTWPDDLAEIVYIDHFGNAMTGLRSVGVNPSSELKINDISLKRENTYSEVPLGCGFWYENSVGLIELAVNQGRSSEILDVSVGTNVKLCDPTHR